MKKVLSLVLALMLVLSCFGSIALADDVPTLKVLVRHDPRCPKIGELDNYKRAEEAAGVKIEWEYITSDAWKEQKSLVLASGDLPDIFIGTQTIHPADILANIEYFIPLDDLVAEYGDQIQEMWEVYPSSKIANTMPDGKVYGIGRYMPNRPTTLIGNYINKVWLDNLGLAMPTTLEEFEQVLIAFRDLDADGDGDATDEVPILARSPSDAKRGIQAFRGYFQAENCVENEFGVIDGKVTFHGRVGKKVDKVLTGLHEIGYRQFFIAPLFTHMSQEVPFDDCVGDLLTAAVPVKECIEAYRVV